MKMALKTIYTKIVKGKKIMFNNIGEKIKKLEDRETHLLRDNRILNEELEKRTATLSTEIKALKESLGRHRGMIGDYVGWAFFFGSVAGTTLFWILK